MSPVGASKEVAGYVTWRGWNPVANAIRSVVVGGAGVVLLTLQAPDPLPVGALAEAEVSIA
jgi:hypothetical protein